MNLHNDREAFHDLIVLSAAEIGIPAAAVKRDYFIVMMLQKLADSEYADQCVFKGGTSLSKCYPGSIMRFSEDIDLTFIPSDETSKKQYDKALKNIEKIMSEGAFVEKIPEERNDRNKSSFVWFDDEDKENTKVKLEIGSSIRPDPFEVRELKTYIQEYLEKHFMGEVVKEYKLIPIKINTLCIERTFLDKVMAVKRHAICGSLERKVRHIYDVTVLFDRPDIQSFLGESVELKKLLEKTKQTDSFYLEKRNVSVDYDPTGAYDFPSWEKYFGNSIRTIYESLHEDLLYTTEKQNFDKAIDTFRKLSTIFSSIGE